MRVVISVLILRQQKRPREGTVCMNAEILRCVKYDERNMSNKI